MRFEKAREALEHAKMFHIQLSLLYEFLATLENTEKVKLLLDYMVQHEREIAESLENYGKNTPVGILDTWLQYTNDKAILKIPEKENLTSKKSMEDIIELSMKFSDELIELYTNITEQVDEVELKYVFTNLADMQKQEKRQLSMNVNRFMDM